MALGFAVILAATPGAIVVPASAAPAAVAAPARVGQEPNDPPIPEDPVDVPWPDEEEESDAEADSLAPGFLVKPSIVIPDSLRSGKGASIPLGGAPAETLSVKPPAAKPKERRTPFGIHPAVFFIALLAGHIFIVGAVTD